MQRLAPRQFARLLASAVVASALSVPLAAVAQPSGQSNPDKTQGSQCFFVSQFEQWRDKDDKTIYIRVNLHEYYRLDMASSCPELTFPDPHLISITRGPDTICSAIDWDLKVADGTTPGNIAVPCIVAKMTKLTPAEADALPKQYKPN